MFGGDEEWNREKAGDSLMGFSALFRQYAPSMVELFLSTYIHSNLLFRN